MLNGKICLGNGTAVLQFQIIPRIHNSEMLVITGNCFLCVNPIELDSQGTLFFFSLPTDGISWTRVVPWSYIIFLTSRKLSKIESSVNPLNVNVLITVGSIEILKRLFFLLFVSSLCVGGMKFMELRCC